MPGRIDAQTSGDTDVSIETTNRPSDAETYRTLLGIQKDITVGKLATVEAVQAVLDEMNLPAFGGPTAEIECAQFDIQRMVRVMQSIDPSLLGQPGVMECAMMWADIVENPGNLRRQRRGLLTVLEGYGLRDKQAQLGIDANQYYELRRQNKIEEAKAILNVIRKEIEGGDISDEVTDKQYRRIELLFKHMQGVTSKRIDTTVEPKPSWARPITMQEIGMTAEEKKTLSAFLRFEG